MEMESHNCIDNVEKSRNIFYINRQSSTNILLKMCYNLLIEKYSRFLRYCKGVERRKNGKEM